MPAAVKALFARKLLKKVAEAYGRMLLIKGLFQADCHPGNILIRDDNGPRYAASGPWCNQQAFSFWVTRGED